MGRAFRTATGPRTLNTPIHKQAQKLNQTPKWAPKTFLGAADTLHAYFARILEFQLKINHKNVARTPADCILSTHSDGYVYVCAADSVFGYTFRNKV